MTENGITLKRSELAPYNFFTTTILPQGDYDFCSIDEFILESSNSGDSFRLEIIGFELRDENLKSFT